MDFDDLIFPGIVIIVLVIVGVVAYASYKDQQRWDMFSKTHHCRLVSHSEGSSALTTGIASSGHVVIGSTYIDGKNGYLCDDGVTYYRDN